MSEEPRITTEDILGEFGFRLVWSVLDHWADVKAYKVEATDENHAPLFWRKGSSTNNGPTPNVDEAESYLEGYVKWDGCTELDQGCPHWCGPDGFKKHFALLRHIYESAFVLMGGEPEEPWDETPET